jgi:hypothetical protein
LYVAFKWAALTVTELFYYYTLKSWFCTRIVFGK